jgi:colanic acid biosynthesis glycosyl transferase WcaI
LREGLLWRAMLKLERFVYRRAAYLLVVTPAARQNLIGKGVPPEMVSVMNNWIDESLFADVDESERPRLRELHGWSDSFVAIFAGNLGMVQGLDTLVRAASMLTNDDRIRVVFVGDGTDRARLQTLTRELNIESRVEFIGRLPMTEMPRYMAAADALVVHLRRSDRARSIIPSKTLAYLAAGKPIVMAMEGAAADLVVEAGAGITLPGDEPEKLAEVLRQLAAMSDDERRAFGRAGKDFLLRTMTRSHVISQYEEILRKVAGQK